MSGLGRTFPAWVMAYHSRRKGEDVSYFDVPGTATAKQDGQTEIGMAGQVFGWPDTGVYKVYRRHSRKHR